ncbi:hypothetical protein V8F33_013039 [Rhypophila sp. PSN 637]
MKSLKATLAGALLTLGAPSTAASYQPQPTVTVIRTVLNLRDEVPGFQIAAIDPTAPGQIGINPAPLDKGSIRINTKWLTEEGGTTKWIGVDSKYITIATTTRTNQAGSTAVATITKGVNAALAADGGLDVLFSPGVRAKLEELAQQVTPCSAKRLRARAKRPKASKRQAACGFKQYQQLAANDDELGGTFTDQLADQTNQQVNGLPNDLSDPHNQANGGEDTDSGYGGSEDGSEHGDEPQSPNDNNDEGFYEGEEGEPGTTAGDTVEAIVISTEEEAAAIAAGEIAPGVVAGGIGVTASSFLATIWGSLSGEGNYLEPVYKIPKERIHKIISSKTRTRTATQTATSSSSRCPTGTGTRFPECGKDCLPTTRDRPAEATKSPTGLWWEWVYSKGNAKDCVCNPVGEEETHYYWADMQGLSNVILNKLKATPEKPVGGLY